MARALATGRTHTIGLVVPDLIHAFFGEVAAGLSKVLGKKGYSLIISFSEEESDLENRAVDQLLAQRVDALILASSQRDWLFLDHLEEQMTPVVLIDRRPSGRKVNFVGVNDEEIGRIATEASDRGRVQTDRAYRRPGDQHGGGMLRGYREALERHGFAFDPHYEIGREHADESSDSSGYEAMGELLALKRRPDGVFCFNDPTTMGAMQAALEQGVRIPQDLAIVGAGNVRYAKFLRVPPPRALFAARRR